MINSIRKKTLNFLTLMGCVAVLGGCYNSTTNYAFFADAPPPPISIPEAPREAITTLTLDSRQLAAVEPAAGDITLSLQDESCAKPKGDVLGYQWGKNSVGMRVGRDATVRYRLSLGERKQFKRGCENENRWNGYAKGMFEN